MKPNRHSQIRVTEVSRQAATVLSIALFCIFLLVSYFSLLVRSTSYVPRTTTSYRLLRTIASLRRHLASLSVSIALSAAQLVIALVIISSGEASQLLSAPNPRASFHHHLAPSDRFISSTRQQSPAFSRLYRETSSHAHGLKIASFLHGSSIYFSLVSSYIRRLHSRYHLSISS